MKITKHTKYAYYEGEEDLEIHSNPLHKKKLFLSLFITFLSPVSFFVFQPGTAFGFTIFVVFISGFYGNRLRNYMKAPCCGATIPRVTLEQPNSPALYECKNCNKLWSGFVVDDELGIG